MGNVSLSMSSKGVYSSFTDGIEDGGGLIEFKIVWHYRRIYPTHCLYQFYEPEHSPQRKTQKEVGIRKVVGPKRFIDFAVYR